jgi:electron transport complex protein RnfD
MAVVGSVFAITIAKQMFGGLGYNPFNPALAGRAFMLISFTGAMTTWRAPGPVLADAVTTATPLGVLQDALKAGAPPSDFGSSMFSDFFFGNNLGGCIGETSALAILIGAAYLFYRRVITWHIPVAYLVSVFVYAVILQYTSSTGATIPAMGHVLTGGLFLGAFFMATDMVTTPVTRLGMLIFGVGCGILTMVIRTSKTGSFPEGVSFAILIMNAFTPLINRLTRGRVFGAKKN